MLKSFSQYPRRVLRYVHTHGGLVLMMVVYAATVIPYINHVPTWDGYLYSTALMEHAHATQNWRQWLPGLALWNHSSYAYIGLLDIAYRLSGHGMWAVMAANVALGLLGIACFYAILRRLTDVLCRWEAGIMAGLLACHPLFMACTVSLNLDFPIAVFLLCALAALLYSRKYWLVLAGTGMVFSKAPGMVLYTLCGAAYLALYAAKRWWRRRPVCNGTADEPARDVVTLLLAAIPLGLYGVYMVLNWHLLAQLNDVTSYQHTSFTYNHARVCVRLLNVFVLNFSWIAAAVCVAAVARRACCRTHAWLRPWQRDMLQVLLCVFAGYLIFNLGITSQIAGVCPRYTLPLTVLLLMFLCVSLCQLCPWPGVRAGFAALLTGALCWQCHTSLDPVSERLYDTVPFGSHRVLRITSCINNRYGVQDEYVYNLEHTVVGDLLNALYSKIGLDAQTPLIVDYNHFLLGRVDPVTKRRTHALDSSFAPTVYDYARIEQGTTPCDAVYVSMPWLADPASERAWLARHYIVTGTERISVRGYELTAYYVTTAAHARAGADLAGAAAALADWHTTPNLLALEKCYARFDTLRRDAMLWPHVARALPTLASNAPALQTLARCLIACKQNAVDAGLLASVRSLATPATFPVYAYLSEQLTGVTTGAAYLLTWPELEVRGMPPFDSLNPLWRHWIHDWYQRQAVPVASHVGASGWLAPDASTSVTVRADSVVYDYAVAQRGFLVCHGTDTEATAIVPTLPCGNRPRSLMVVFSINRIAPGRLLWYGSTAAAKHMCALAIDHACRFYFWGYGIDVVVPAAPVLSEWHCLAATFDGARLVVYYDGAPTASYTGELDTDITPVYLGGGFHGRIADAKIWRCALSEEEMRAAMTQTLRSLQLKEMPWQAITAK